MEARVLGGPGPGGSTSGKMSAGKTRAASNHVPVRRSSPHSHILLAAYPAMAMPDPQRPGGGGGGGTGGGGGRGGSGGTGGGAGGGGRGGSGGTGGGTGAGGKGGSGGGTGSGGKGGSGGGGSRGGGFTNSNNSTFNQPRTIVPPFPPSASTNQQIMAALAEGTGGFTIFKTNDPLPGLQPLRPEQHEVYYLC